MSTPTSPNTSSSRHPSIFSRPDAAIGLSRRAHNSSSTDYGDGLIGPLHSLTASGLDSEPFRVGGPDLDLLPFIRTAPESSRHDEFIKKIRPHLMPILKAHGVTENGFYFNLEYFRSAARPNAQVCQYAYVELPYHEDCRPLWEKLADDLYGKVREIGYANNLKVLVAARNALKSPVSLPLEAGSALSLAWPKVAQSIVSLLTEQSLGSWNSLMLVKRSHPLIKGNQDVPTVCIGIQWDSADMWTAAAPAIKALLKKDTLWAQEAVALEIIRSYLGGGHTSDSGEPAENPTLPAIPEEDRLLRSRAYLGASICTKSMEDQGILSGASFGCSITLDKEEQQYGLTNCHVILPSSNTTESYAHPSAQTYLDASIIPLLPTGAKPGSIPGPTAVLMPARVDLEEYLAQQQEDMKEAKASLDALPYDLEALAEGFAPRTVMDTYKTAQRRIGEYEQNIERATQLLGSDRILGHTYCFSGFRKNETSNQILDWALIKLEKDKGPTHNTVPSHGLAEKLPGTYLHGFHDATAGEIVYKVGRTTRLTKGKVNSTETYLNAKYLGVWPEDEDSSQDKWTLSKPMAAAVEVGSFCGHFCEPGDSGAVVFSTKLNIVGLFVTGNMSLGAGFFTPQKELIEDIKEKTGATMVHLAGTRDDIDWDDEDILERMRKTRI